MLVAFDQMPDTSRLWIYQAERELTEPEIAFIRETSSLFIKEWTAHGNDLKASFEVLYNRFLIITLDENVSQASGCSIDASVNFIRTLESELGISLLNNDKVAFMIEEDIELLPVHGLRSKVAEKMVLPSTKVFNNTVQNLGDFKEKWLVESGETWLNRFFN